MTTSTVETLTIGNDAAAAAPHENVSIRISDISEAFADPLQIAAEAAAMPRINADAGNLQKEYEGLRSRYEANEARLAEVVYDERTGEASPRIVGNVREALEIESKNLYNQAVYAFVRAQVAREQEQAALNERERRAEAEAEAFGFHGGDPAKKALFAQELDRARAAKAAQAYLDRLG